MQLRLRAVGRSQEPLPGRNPVAHKTRFACRQTTASQAKQHAGASAQRQRGRSDPRAAAQTERYPTLFPAKGCQADVRASQNSAESSSAEEPAFAAESDSAEEAPVDAPVDDCQASPNSRHCPALERDPKSGHRPDQACSNARASDGGSPASVKRRSKSTKRMMAPCRRGGNLRLDSAPRTRNCACVW